MPTGAPIPPGSGARGGGRVVRLAGYGRRGGRGEGTPLGRGRVDAPDPLLRPVWQIEPDETDFPSVTARLAGWPAAQVAPPAGCRHRMNPSSGNTTPNQRRSANGARRDRTNSSNDSVTPDIAINRAAQLMLHPVNDICPIAHLFLPEQARARVPGAIASIHQPTPVRIVRQ